MLYFAAFIILLNTECVVRAIQVRAVHPTAVKALSGSTKVYLY